MAGAEPGISATQPRTIRFSDDEPRVTLSLQAPAAFPSTVSWMWTGLREYPLTSVVALAVGWLTMYTAVWLAGLGAIVGLVVGVVLEFTAGAATRAPALAPALGFFLPFDRVLAFLGLLTSGISGVVGLVPILLAPIAGAVRGFVAGFMFPLFGGLVVPGGLEVVLGIVASRVLTGFIVAILWVVLATMLEPATVRLSGARDLSRREKARLLPLMQQCVEKLNLERHPMLMVSDERIISAWATNTRIVFTRGFLERFWRDQEAIGGVLAHELQHWASGQTMGQQFVWALALPIGILNGLYYEVVSRVKHPVVQYALALFAWPLSFMLRFMVAPTWAHENRRQEFECDQAAVRAGYREGLYRVLRVYRDFEGGAGGWSRCPGRPSTRRVPPRTPRGQRSR